ncbi:hypothetical protein [Deinococcus wulumuqiensis]|uniref:hypothetical protein n=1 Tax=Deinococcus wulumuqiensis TaxID=980427 RepID=UPI002432FFA7|nr:hypothetical protein [Deinococcus wulumuqiensis]
MSVPVYPMYERQPRPRRLLALAHALLTWLLLGTLVLACCAESVLGALVLGLLAAVLYGLRLIVERR